MKTKEINQKKVVNKAYELVCSKYSVCCKKYFQPWYFRKNLDFRTNFDKAVFLEITKLLKTLDFSEIAKKQKHRAINKFIETPVNYLNSPLFIDFKANKRDILRINDNCIQFRTGRNHYVKNQKDIVLLSILKKYVNNGKTL